MTRIITLSLFIFSSSAFSQTFDDVMKQRRAAEEQSRLQNEIALYHARNQKMVNSISVFAAGIGQSVQSGPSCVTYTDEDKRREYGMSFWPGTYSAMERDVWRTNSYSHCNFTTSGGKLCKSYGTVISCVTGQQPVETFCVENGRVRLPGKNGFCGSPRSKRTFRP